MMRSHGWMWRGRSCSGQGFGHRRRPWWRRRWIVGEEVSVSFLLCRPWAYFCGRRVGPKIIRQFCKLVLGQAHLSKKHTGLRVDTTRSGGSGADARRRGPSAQAGARLVACAGGGEGGREGGGARGRGGAGPEADRSRLRKGKLRKRGPVSFFYRNFLFRCRLNRLTPKS